MMATFKQKLAYAIQPAGNPLAGATKPSTGTVSMPEVPSIWQRKIATKAPVPPAAADAQAASSAMKPGTKTAAIQAILTKSSGCAPTTPKVKKAPRYSSSGKKGKKVMPMPHARRTKKANPTADMAAAAGSAAPPKSNVLKNLLASISGGTLGHAALYGGTGAALGAGRNMFRDEEDETSMTSDMLGGGLLGAGAGIGGNMIAGGLRGAMGAGAASPMAKAGEAYAAGAHDYLMGTQTDHTPGNPIDLVGVDHAHKQWAQFLGWGNTKRAFGSGPDASEIVDMDSTGGALADYLRPSTWGGERSGRSQAMAGASGQDTSFNVRHPLTHQILSALAGGGTGAVLGGLSGAGIGALAGGPDGAQTGGLIGAGVGGGGGLIGGSALSGLFRRAKMREINKGYDAANAQGKLNPKDPKFSILSALLAPGRGPHRTGQAEAVKAMRNESTIDDSRGAGRSALYAAPELLGPTVGGPLSMLHGYAQNYKTQMGSGSAKKREAQAKRVAADKPETKEEDDIQQEAALA